mmetsp:Transcript_8585/g.17487  ORF Transcript_8585/g.17487 Transcript_8585/m.17487 type:complete len:237 (+) Transcript_8585:172-882(+)
MVTGGLMRSSGPSRPRRTCPRRRRRPRPGALGQATRRRVTPTTRSLRWRPRRASRSSARATAPAPSTRCWASPWQRVKKTCGCSTWRTRCSPRPASRPWGRPGRKSSPWRTERCSSTSPSPWRGDAKTAPCSRRSWPPSPRTGRRTTPLGTLLTSLFGSPPSRGSRRQRQQWGRRQPLLLLPPPPPLPWRRRVGPRRTRWPLTLRCAQSRRRSTSCTSASPRPKAKQCARCASSTT